MPGSYLIDVSLGIVFSRGWGVLTDAELISHAATLRADSRFNPGLRQVVDFLGLTKLDITSGAVSEVAQKNPFRRDSRRAFIVPSVETLGVTRMFELYMGADPEQFKIFQALAPALQWVGLDPETGWPTRAPDVTFGVS